MAFISGYSATTPSRFTLTTAGRSGRPIMTRSVSWRRCCSAASCGIQLSLLCSRKYLLWLLYPITVQISESSDHIFTGGLLVKVKLIQVGPNSFIQFQFNEYFQYSLVVVTLAGRNPGRCWQVIFKGIQRHLARFFISNHDNINVNTKLYLANSDCQLFCVFCRLHNGTPLSSLLRQSMSVDPVAPILWEPHLAALDRRIVIVLNAIRKCVEKSSNHPEDIADFV